VVGHSLGGLVLAQVVYSGDRAAEGDSISSVAQKIKGMIFLGTPFYDSKIAGWGEAVRRIYSLVQKTDQNTLRNLTLDSKELKEYIPLLQQETRRGLRARLRQSLERKRKKRQQKPRALWLTARKGRVTAFMNQYILLEEAQEEKDRSHTQ
jgi:hypothetical protein